MNSLPPRLEQSPHKRSEAAAVVGATTPTRARTGLMAYLAVLATAYTFYFASDIFIPLFVALLLKLLLSPLMRLIMRARIPQGLAALMVMVLLIAGVGGLFYTVEAPAEHWVHNVGHELPKMRGRLRNIISPLQQVQQATRQVEQAAQPDQTERTVVVRQTGLSEYLFRGTRNFLTVIATVLVLLFALLATGDHFLRRTVESLPRFADKRHAVEVARMVEHDISRYLTTITLINITMGCVAGLISWAIGLPDPLLWGVLAGLLNYIPYLGPLTMVCVLAFVGIMTFPKLADGLLPAAIYAGATLLEGNLLTPMLLSHRLEINAVCVFVGLMMFAFIWGIPGMLLAVPLLAMTRIVCDHIEPLMPVGRFLGSGRTTNSEIAEQQAAESRQSAAE